MFNKLAKIWNRLLNKQKPCTCVKNNDYCKCPITKEQIKGYN